MRVGDEVEEVGRGTLILVPPNTDHSIKNIGEETLIYVSSTSPPFAMQEGNTNWTTPGVTNRATHRGIRQTLLVANGKSDERRRPGPVAGWVVRAAL